MAIAKEDARKLLALFETRDRLERVRESVRGNDKFWRAFFSRCGDPGSDNSVAIRRDSSDVIDSIGGPEIFVEAMADAWGEFSDQLIERLNAQIKDAGGQP